MTHDLHETPVVLSKEQMTFLIRLLLFTLAATSQESEKEFAYLQTSDTTWKSFPFETERVMKFLMKRIGMQSEWLKRGYNPALLIGFLDWISFSENESFDITLLSEDIPTLQSCYRSAVDAFFCINDLGGVFQDTPLEEIQKELFATPAVQPTTNQEATP